tara:strand:- start:546 stop:1184 length:639 start_codon:yes stop_codon:yes gene_type:complete
MSASQGLSAARRRRAGSQPSNQNVLPTTPAPSPNTSSRIPDIDENGIPKFTSAPSGAQNPVQLLLIHERRISVMEETLPQAMTMLEEKLDTLLASNEQVVQEVRQDDYSNFSAEEEIKNIHEIIGKINSTPAPSIQDSSNQKQYIEKLEKEINSLKALVIKVQTFAMETNTELLKLKHGNIELTSDEKNEIHDVTNKSLDEQSEILTTVREE